MKKSLRRLLVIALSAMVALSMGSAVFAYTAQDDDGDRSKAGEGTMGVVYSSMGMFRTDDAATSVTLNEDGDATVVVKTVYTKSSNYDRMVLADYPLEGTKEEIDAQLDKMAITADNIGADGNIADTKVDADGNTTYSAQFTFVIPTEDFGKRIPYILSQGGKWKDKAYYFVVVKAPMTVEKEDGMMMSFEGASLAINGPEDHALSITMKNSTSYDKVRIAGQTEEIAIDENKTFVNIPVSVDDVNVIEFHAVKSGNWFKRDVTVDVEEANVYIEDHRKTVEDLDNLTYDETIQYAEENANPRMVDSLIEAIQVQYRDVNTDRYCAAAKAAWDKLTDEEKEEVDDPDYFGFDTGDASKDDPLNQDEIGKKELLVVSFGTSFNDSRAADIGGIEKALAEAYPDWSVRRAFTAQIIINHVQARDGEAIDNMDQALQRAVDNGVEELVIQPTHLMHGAEYDEMAAAVDAVKASFKSVKIAEPLLGQVGASAEVVNADKKAVAEAAVAAAVAYEGAASIDALAEAKTAVVFMGHGTAHNASITYEQMQTQMNELGYKNVFVGTVEGIPASTSLPEVKKAIDAAGYTKVILRPLMVVAGDHANNDMAGDWADALINGGEFEVEGADAPVNIGTGYGEGNVTSQIEGLGRIEAVQQLYVAHTDNAINPPAAAQTLKIAKSAKTVKAKKLKKKAQVTSKVKVTGAKTTVTYAKVKKGSDKRLTINKKNGKITVKKGTKKGTYKIKIKVTAKATAAYKAASATATIKVRVK